MLDQAFSCISSLPMFLFLYLCFHSVRGHGIKGPALLILIADYDSSQSQNVCSKSLFMLPFKLP